MIKLIFLNDQPNNLRQHYSVDILNFSVVFQAFSSSKNNKKKLVLQFYFWEAREFKKSPKHKKEYF